MPSQLVHEVVEVDATVGVLTDRDDVGDRLSPRELVRVVLVRADEDDRAIAVTEVAKSQSAPAAGAEDLHELVDRGGRARAGEEHDVVAATVHRAMDDLARVLP